MFSNISEVKRVFHEDSFESLASSLLHHPKKITVPATYGTDSNLTYFVKFWDFAQSLNSVSLSASKYFLFNTMPS